MQYLLIISISQLQDSKLIFTITVLKSPFKSNLSELNVNLVRPPTVELWLDPPETVTENADCKGLVT